MKCNNTNKNHLKPFVKWAGGKSKLLGSIRKCLPAGIGARINRYCEPFVGGGAVLFDLLQRYKFDSVYISDINPELINTYIVIRDNVDDLIQKLKEMENEYLALEQVERGCYYYKQREDFNNVKGDFSRGVYRAALFIFLNKTCFNGLFRVNRKGFFNVPVGDYKSPVICDASNLLNASHALQNVTILNADYSDSFSFIDENTFVYIDPPYRPLSKTACFTAYAEGCFGDKEQIKLAHYAFELDAKGAKVLVSNSNPKNTDKEDDFFERLYHLFYMDTVSSRHMINCKGAERSLITELLIYNF